MSLVEKIDDILTKHKNGVMDIENAKLKLTRIVLIHSSSGGDIPLKETFYLDKPKKYN